MTDIDPAAIKQKHGDLHICVDGLYWNMRVNGDPCEPYRLADALVTERAKVARVETERDEARARAVMLRGIVEGVDEALGKLPYDDCLVDYNRPALADQPEQEQPKWSACPHGVPTLHGVTVRWCQSYSDTQDDDDAPRAGDTETGPMPPVVDPYLRSRDA